MARVDLLPRPESQYIYWAPQKKDPLNPLESLKWHWLFLPPIGANAYMCLIKKIVVLAEVAKSSHKYFQPK